jgi:hypothetical protein
VDGPRGDDATATGAWSRPFRTIGAAIAAAAASPEIASSRVNVHVWPGRYLESFRTPPRIRVLGKGADLVLIEGAAGVPVTVGLGQDAGLEGVRVVGSGSDVTGACIDVYGATGVRIESVVVVECGTGIAVNESQVLLRNVTLVDNNRHAISARYSSIEVVNAIVSQNGASALYARIGGASMQVRFSDFFSNAENADGQVVPGAGLLFEPPRFSDPFFHLEPGSPARDAGDGTDPDGSRAAMGAYGGERLPIPAYPTPGLLPLAALAVTALLTLSLRARRSRRRS